MTERSESRERISASGPPLARPGPSFGVHPHGAQPDRGRARDIAHGVVAHVHDALGRRAGGVERKLEDGGIGLRRPGLGRCHHEVEVVTDSDPVHVGVAVGDRADCVALAEPFEHARHVVEEGDGVAVLPEHPESGFRQLRTVPPLAQQ